MQKQQTEFEQLQSQLEASVQDKVSLHAAGTVTCGWVCACACGCVWGMYIPSGATLCVLTICTFCSVYAYFVDFALLNSWILAIVLCVPIDV